MPIRFIDMKRLEQPQPEAEKLQQLLDKSSKLDQALLSTVLRAAEVAATSATPSPNNQQSTRKISSSGTTISPEPKSSTEE